VLERFDGYFGAKPDWEKVTYRAITNDAARDRRVAQWRCRS
jgi:ABC-type transport system substrate-binding protein